MKIYDISVPLSKDLPVYPGDRGCKIKPLAQMSKGSPYNLSLLSMGTHTGTHVDPPVHFIQGGRTVDALPLEAMVGPAYVAEMMDQDFISAEGLDRAAIPKDVERLLLKTRNCALWEHKEFVENFVYITESGAKWIADRGLKLVGIDYLSVEKYKADQPVAHTTLLGAGIVVAEGLDLREVPAGRYFLVFLPLKINGGDGAPARAILLEDYVV
ncbi:MAG: cyclase family protein [Dehalococcoidia bacterium]|nr:cyclase family protein [Dehalococcoidia bacterium]